MCAVVGLGTFGGQTEGEKSRQVVTFEMRSEHGAQQRRRVHVDRRRGRQSLAFGAVAAHAAAATGRRRVVLASVPAAHVLVVLVALLKSVQRQRLFPFAQRRLERSCW